MKNNIKLFVIVIILVFCLMPSCSPRNQEETRPSPSPSRAVSQTPSLGTPSQIPSPENLDKLSYDELVNLGKNYGKSRDYRQALKVFDKAIEIDKNKPDAYSGRAFIYYDTKKYNLSITDLSKAIELNPNSIENYKLRGNIYFTLRDYDRSLTDYNKVLELDPKNIDALSRRAHILFKNKDYKAALKDTNKALKLDKSKYDLYLDRGAEHYLLENNESALRDYKTALKLNPESGEAMVGIAMTLMSFDKNDKYKEALEYFNKAEELYRKLPEPVKESIYDGHALDLNNIYMNRSQVYPELGEFQKAVDDCNRYISLQETRGNEKGIGIYFVRGEAYMLLGEKEKGRKDVTMWLEAWLAEGNDPETSTEYGVLGQTYLFQKKYKTALKYFNKDLKLNPTSPWSLLFRGTTYFEMGRYEEAKKDLEKIVANPEIPFMKGIALDLIKKMDKKKL